jgi:hypothetical protein
VSLFEQVTSSSRDCLDDGWHGTGGMGAEMAAACNVSIVPQFLWVVRAISMWNGLRLDATDVSEASPVGSASMQRLGDGVSS